MLSRIIAGGASLLMQVLVVVAIVLLFMWWDPFGILLPTKRTLKDTPVQVESIKKLGELITAEYYGEVIASLGETIETRKEEDVEEFADLMETLHNEFKLAIEDLVLLNGLGKKDRALKEFQKEFPEVVNDPNYAIYLNYIHEKLKNKEYKGNDLEQTLTPQNEKKLIRRLYNNTSEWRIALNDIDPVDFISAFEQVIEKRNNKDFRKARLAMIGRGWVKAGFDFEEFDQNNFRYLESQKSIHFIGVQPKIISATINPWFIPEEQVEGFEFLIVEKAAKRKMEYTNMVKQLCLDKLSAQAYEKNILEQAEENAEANLRGFFSLLLGEEVRKVSFHSDLLSSASESLLLDGRISNEEIYFLQDVIKQYYELNAKNKKREQRIAEFLIEMKSHGFHIFQHHIPLNSRSALLMRVLEDHIYDEKDEALIAKELENLQEVDLVWNLDSEDGTPEDAANRDMKGFRPLLDGLVNKDIDIKKALSNNTLAVDTGRVAQ